MGEPRSSVPSIRLFFRFVKVYNYARKILLRKELNTKTFINQDLDRFRDHCIRPFGECGASAPRSPRPKATHEPLRSSTSAAYAIFLLAVYAGLKARTTRANRTQLLRNWSSTMISLRRSRLPSQIALIWLSRWPDLRASGAISLFSKSTSDQSMRSLRSPARWAQAQPISLTRSARLSRLRKYMLSAGATTLPDRRANGDDGAAPRRRGSHLSKEMGCLPKENGSIIAYGREKWKSPSTLLKVKEDTSHASKNGETLARDHPICELDGDVRCMPQQEQRTRKPRASADRDRLSSERA